MERERLDSDVAGHLAWSTRPRTWGVETGRAAITRTGPSPPEFLVTARRYAWSSELDLAPRLAHRAVRSSVPTRSDRSCLARPILGLPAHRRHPCAARTSTISMVPRLRRVRGRVHYCWPPFVDSAEISARSCRWPPTSPTPMSGQQPASQLQPTGRSGSRHRDRPGNGTQPFARSEWSRNGTVAVTIAAPVHCWSTTMCPTTRAVAGRWWRNCTCDAPAAIASGIGPDEGPSRLVGRTVGC